MKNHQFKNKDLLIVVFDDQITTLDIVINGLKREGHQIKGQPVYLKINAKDIPSASPSPASQQLL